MSVAAVGSTGAGKSTLCGILCGDTSGATFPVGATLSSMTSKSKMVNNIIDTAGFDDGANSKIKEAEIYDDIFKTLIPLAMKAILFVWSFGARIASYDRKNLDIFAKIPDAINKAIVVTKFSLTENETRASCIGKIRDQLQGTTLSNVRIFVVDSAMYNSNDQTYQALKNIPPFSLKHEENQQSFNELKEFIRTSTAVVCKEDLLRIYSENPFKLEIQANIESKMNTVISSVQQEIFNSVEELIEKDMNNEEFKSSIDKLRESGINKIKTAYTNQISEQERRLIPLENFSSYQGFSKQNAEFLDKKYINYIKIREKRLLKGLTLDLISSISKQLSKIYEQTNDPFETISKINKIWADKQVEIANNPLLDDDEIIDTWEEVKDYVENELSTFRKLIFGNPYTSTIKSKVLSWSVETNHLQNDSYKDLHKITVVKCPSCSYPWGNFGMCQNRTCLFCLHNFKWNEASVATKSDWDSYDYKPAFVPQVGSSPSYRSDSTIPVRSLK